MILKEAIISLVVGGAPIGIIYSFGNSEKVVRSLNSINPGDPVVWYFFTLFVIHCLAFVFNRHFLKQSEPLSRTSESLHEITHEVGFAIQTIYRAIAGAIPVVTIIMIAEEGWEESLSALAIAGLFFVACFAMSCFFSWVSSRTKPRAKLF